MHRHHGPLRVSALGPLTLASIFFATALIVDEPHARADTPQVTVGGPFTLTAPDRTTVTDATYRGKWLMVFFGYNFCPDTCPTTLMKIAGALEKPPRRHKIATDRHHRRS